MNRESHLRTVAVMVLIGAVAFAAVSGLAEDPKKELQDAYVKGKLSLQEVVARKDSVFAMVNEMYQPVKPILQKSCFDCHSQSTCYPWYYKLPLIKGMIDDDIRKARERLDMSHDFPFSGRVNSLKLLTEIREEVEHGEMPLLSYRLLHWGTLIEGERQDSLFAWIDTTTAILTAFYQELVPQEISDTL